MIGFGRLSVSVKKSTVIASVEIPHDYQDRDWRTLISTLEPRYITIEWRGAS